MLPLRILGHVRHAFVLSCPASGPTASTAPTRPCTSLHHHSHNLSLISRPHILPMATAATSRCLLQISNSSGTLRRRPLHHPCTRRRRRIPRARTSTTQSSMATPSPYHTTFTTHPFITSPWAPQPWSTSIIPRRPRQLSRPLRFSTLRIPCLQLPTKRSTRTMRRGTWRISWALSRWTRRALRRI